MEGSKAKMIGFMEGADKRYIIPVYQRKYDWKYDNCRQLYEDLKKIVNNGRDSHFFGSIVSAVVPNGSKIEYHIIDGQQRLTTVTLLLLAIRNLIAQGKVTAEEGKLDEQISQRFLISPWASEEDKIKLRPVKSDREALVKLFGDEEDYDRSSNLTINYQFFCDMVIKEEVPVASLYAAIGKLEIISITLDQGDNAHLIFESLNSTGLALTEGDKIRNYVLMGLSAKDQAKYYDAYWAKIEKCTANDVSGFVRDYLSIKQQVTPAMSNIYRVFKEYAESIPIDTLLADLLRYARFFEKLLICKSGLKEQKLDDCLYRLMRLEIVVTRPFLMEVLRLHQDNKLSVEDVRKIFLITENYLFRRNICEVPTNALNKIFLNLNKEILRYDNTANDYVAKFIYALLSKKESGRFPNDTEFSSALAEKQVYQMRGKYKAYLFERFENYGTIETKDVYTHLDNNVYTIEHIMPQHLTPAWKESLGVNAEEIHSVWLHRLANLTLTGYNPKLSNHTFTEKRDAKEGGYKASGLKINQKIAAKQTYQKDKSVLTALAYATKISTELVAYVSNHESELRSALKIDANVYIEKNTSTTMKMSILRRIFALYEADPMDLVFYLKDADTKKSSDASELDIRKRYWKYALPIIQEQHIYRGTFSCCTPTTSNMKSGSFGIRGFCISCIANYNNARVDFYLGSSDTQKNKAAFDLLYKHKTKIENELGISLNWNRADHNKASWICYHLGGVSVANEADWPRMAKFHAEWSDKICGAMLEYLLDDKEKRRISLEANLAEKMKS